MASRTILRQISVPYLRDAIEARRGVGWVPVDPDVLAALLDALETDRVWFALGTTANWQARCKAAEIFDFGDEL